MFKYIYSTFIFFMLLCISCTSEDETKITTDEFSNQIGNSEIAAIIKENISNFPNNTQVSIALIDNAETEYIGVVRNGDTFEIIENENSIFEIGSITKVFTSILLSDLIEKNEATLNETLQSQFDFTIKEGGNIKLEQLANHTSGLPRLPTNYESVDYDEQDPFANYTSDLLNSYLENYAVLNNVTGSEFEYSNLGIGLLGHILSKKTGKTYEDFIQETIFKPLNMNASTTLLSNVNTTSLVKGLNANGAEIPNWNFTNATVGAGGIKSSVVDLEKFVRKNFEDTTVYNLPQQPTYEVTNDYGIGLGWQIIKDDTFTILLHDGSTGGYTSMLSLDKNNKRAVIVLSNVSGVSTQAENISTLNLALLANLSGV